MDLHSGDQAKADPLTPAPQHLWDTLARERWSLTPLLQELGKQHQNYGVQECLFKQFGDTLIKLMEELLGGDFTDVLRAAWLEVFVEISRKMRPVEHDH